MDIDDYFVSIERIYRISREYMLKQLIGDKVGEKDERSFKKS